MSTQIEQVIGFDLGGTNCKSWFTNKETIIPTDVDLSSSSEKAILEFLHSAIASNKGVTAISVALPCTMLLNKDSRRILPTSSKFSRLSEGTHHGVIEAMEVIWSKELQIPVFIIDDGEAASLEAIDILKNDPGGQTYQNFVAVTLGTSIGVGFIFNSMPYRGPFTSRASHIILDPQGPWCPEDTHRGCWKSLAGASARNELALNMGLRDPQDRTHGLSLEAIAQKAKSGSKKAELYFQYYAESIAKGVAALINAVPVECVVIAGGVGTLGEMILITLKEKLLRGDLLDPDLAPLVEIIHKNEFCVSRGAQIYGLKRLARGKQCASQPS